MDRAPPLSDEAEVVARAQAGQVSAFATLYRTYAPPLFAHVLVPMLGDQDDAHDCLRETFIAAHRALPHYEWRDVGIYPWLKVLAKNKAKDMLRAAGRRQRLRGAFAEELQALGGSADTVAELDVARRRLRAAIDEVLEDLNPRYATVLRLRLLEERSREECAATLEVTLGTLDVLLFRACRAFRTACEREGGSLKADLHAMVPSGVHP